MKREQDEERARGRETKRAVAKLKTDEEATRHKSFIGDCNWLAQTTDPMLAPYVSIIGIKESKTITRKK